MLKGRALPLVATALVCTFAPGAIHLIAAQRAAAGQVRDPTGRPPVARAGTARLSGTVVLEATGQPAVGTRVMLNGQDLPGGKSAITDAQGKFSFTALPAGRYTVQASKPGYVNTSYGQRRPRMPPTMIPLAEGQSMSISLQLARAAVITGMVLDERGEPSVNTFVRAMRSMLIAGDRTFQQQGGVSTDDRGIYRIHSLEPGDYIVCASTRSMSDMHMSDPQRLRMQIEGMRRSLDRASARGGAAQRQAMMRTIERLEARLAEDAGPATGYAPVCYPGTSHTSTLSVSAGDERSGVDLQLHLTQVARVEGVLLMPEKPGAPSFDGVQLTLVSTDEVFAAGDTHGGMADGTGRFSFMNVPPGNYRLLARTGSMFGRPFMPGRAPDAPEEPALWGGVELTVAGEDIDNITVHMQRGVTVSGRIVFEGARQPPAELSGLQVGLSPNRPASPMAQFASGAIGAADNTGRFTIPDVLPGEYRLYAIAPGWFMDSAYLSGRDVLDEPLDVSAGRHVSGIVFTLTDRTAELSGTLLDAKGEPAIERTVLLFADDEKHWRPNSRRIRPARVMPDGKYLIQNVPPGEYRLAAFVDAEPGSFSDPAFIEQLAPSAVRISLMRGEKKIHNFRVQ